MNEALRRLEPRVRDAFLSAIQAHANSINLTALAQAIEDGDIAAAGEIAAIPQAVLFPLDEAIRAAYLEGAALAEMPRTVGGLFAFNGRHPRAEQWIAQSGAELIQGIQADTLESVRRVIVAGMEQNTGARSIALQIVGRKVGQRREGGIIGLTAEMTDNVMTARAVLSNPATLAEYFKPDGSPRWKLSDRRFDALVRRAIAGKAKLTATDIDKITAAHKSKALKYRGSLIARNETFQAQAAGRDEAYRQMLDDPRIEKVTVRWQHNLSKEPRLDHLAMNGTIIELGQTFDFPDGAKLKHPHDPNGPARHNLNCRCIGVYRAIPRRS